MRDRLSSVFAILALILSTLTAASPAAAAPCTLVPQLRDVTINQGLGQYPKLVQGKEALVRAYLSLPSCASTSNAIRLVGGTLTVRAGALTSTVQAPFPAQSTPFPLISPFYRTTPPVDSPGDPKFVVTGPMLNPSGTPGFTASFSLSVQYQSSTDGVNFGSTQTTPAFTQIPATKAPISKLVERETNPLRVLVVPVGNASLSYASQYSATANAQLQLAMQTVSRTFPVADGTGELTATTGGVRYTVDPTLIDIRAQLESDGRFCLKGTNFDNPIKGQLTTLAQEWESENPGLQIDVALAVVDPAIASLTGACAEGFGVYGSSYSSAAGLAVAKLTPGQGGATVAMEIAHALGMVPTSRGRAGDPAHSPFIAADAGSNRGYNLRDRAFLADDRTALYNSGTGFTNTSTLMEQLDYQFLLCALGGATTTDCSVPGAIGNNVPSGPRFVISGTVAPDGQSASLIVAYSSDVPATPAGTQGPFTLQQINVPASGPPQVLRSDFVPVSFGGTNHGDGPHAAGAVDVAVPFNSDADRVEFRNGSTVLATFNASAVPQLTSFSVTPGGEENYTNSAIDDESPVVSPDGEWVAWTEDPGGEDLSRIQVGPIGDSSAAVELTDDDPTFSGQDQYEPAWRADGQALALISDGDLWMVDVDTSSGTPVFSNLTFVIGYDEIDDTGLFTGHPSWSPDGSQIAFDAEGAIFVVDAVEDATGTETQLTFTGDASNPSWSQTDGDARIAYQRTPPVEVALAGTLMSYVEPVREKRVGVTDHAGSQFTVTAATDEEDPGEACEGAPGCSLREAINAANANPGMDSIHFAIGTGFQSIPIGSSLPTIAEQVIIDATTQPGFAGDPIIELVGESFSVIGFRVTSGGSEVRGFVLNGFGAAISLQTEGSNVVAGNWIGTDATGSVAAANNNGVISNLTTPSGPNVIGGVTAADRNVISGNLGAGVHTTGTEGSFVRGNYIGLTADGTAGLGNIGSGVFIQSPGNIIGGSEAGAGNVVSGNGDLVGLGAGVAVESGTANVIQGNRIGTDATGMSPIPNTRRGMIVRDSFTVIGGELPGEGNLISGNTLADGIFIVGSPTQPADVTVVKGNLIGVDATGIAPLPNGNGIEVSTDTADTNIGGTGESAGNVIAGNAGNGLALGPGSLETFVEGNLIGVGADGSTPVGNSAAGVLILNGTFHEIGGFELGSGNVIAYNEGEGVRVELDGADSNGIHRNAIFANGALGIDLGGDGVTNNDAGDADTGPNDEQNFPVLTSAADNGATATVSGSLNSVASQTYRVEFFRNTACDATGNGEGEAFIGSQDVTTDAGGDATFTAVLAAPDVVAGDQITSTATDPAGNTSEFSACVTATSDTASFEVNSSADTTDPAGCTVSHCTLREAMLRANAEVGADTITFDIPGTGPHAIALGSSLPTIDEDVVIDGTSQPGYVDSPQVEIYGSAVGEGSIGLQIAASNVTVKGLTIADFNSHAIVVNGSGIFIEANLIGGAEQGNGGHGVLLESGSQIAVGGPTPAQANEISENGGAGIAVLEGADFNPLRGNSIHDNGGIGIDLAVGLSADGVTPNDSLDADSGGNDEMNFPQILNAAFDGAETTITGVLDSEDNLAPPTIDVYSNSSCDSSGNGEGELFQGTTTIPGGLDASGHGEWTLIVDGDLTTTILTATASDVTPQTSEFSLCFLPDAASFTVNTTDDDDDGACTTAHCSLREAILRANAEPNGDGADVISFDIPGIASPSAPHVISVGSALPEITETVAIDGTTEPDFDTGTDVPIVQVDGAALTDDTTSGLVLALGTSSIRGLSITSFPIAGILVESDGNEIVGNYIGIAPDGVNAAGNGTGTLGGYGVLVRDGDSNAIGLSDPPSSFVTNRNVISGNNGVGVAILRSGAVGEDVANNSVENNFIGTDASGSTAVPNTVGGVALQRGTSNAIGGLNPGTGNVISGNEGDGVVIFGSSGGSNFVQNNSIGTDASGEGSLPNTRDGVQINEASDVTVGGVNFTLEESAGNVIANNGRHGVVIRAADEGVVTSGFLTGNSIVNNGDHGVLIDLVSGVQVGADSFLAGNYIADNGGDGVSIGSGSGNIVSANEIENNGGLGIDLGPDGPTANDTASPPDADTGANGLQNFPSVTVNGDGSRITGTLISTPDMDFDIELFVSPACDASDHGEGAMFETSVGVTTNQFGYGFFEYEPVIPILESEVVTATAIGPEGTSEFSACAVPSEPGNEIWTLDPENPGATQELLVENAVQPSWGTTGEVAFARGGDIYTIRSDKTGERQLTDTAAVDSMPSLGGVTAFVRFVEDVDLGNQFDVFLLRDDFEVTVTASDDHPDQVRLNLIYTCTGSPDYVVAVGLRPQQVGTTTASWETRHDPSLGCPDGVLRPVLLDFWNKTGPLGSGVQINTDPQPPVAAIYVPEVGDTLLAWNALALHGSGKDPEDGELSSTRLQWFVDGVEVDYASCPVSPGHCDLQPPGGQWPIASGQLSRPMTIELLVADSSGATDTDSVTIQVLRDDDEDGMPAQVETQCAGLSDSIAKDAFADRDGDLYLNQDDYALGGSPCVAATSYPADVLFMPDTLFVPSMGDAVTMTVRLPLRDIKTVTRSSVRLQLISGEVVAIQNMGWTVDKNGVGIAKFDRQRVIQALIDLDLVGTTAYYTIVGTSTQGWSFEGTDGAQVTPAN